MPYSILIAEDEAVEREALQLFIERTFGEAVYLSIAENGIELEEKITSLKPDIVIADIEMPGLNGLEALTRCRTEGYRPRIILQTAYSQFEYAHSAIKLEVSAYLLKPIKRDVIAQKISEILKELEKERSTELLRRREMRLIKNSGPIIEQDIITSLQMDQSPGEMFLLYTAFLGIANTRYFVVSLNLGSTWSSTKERTIRYLRETGCGPYPVIAGVIGRGRFSLVVAANESSSYRRKISSIEAVANMIHKLEQEYSGSVSAGIGLDVTSMEKLSFSYRQSLQALEATVDSPRVMHFEDIVTGCGSSMLTEDQIEVLNTAIAAGDPEVLEREVSRIIANDDTEESDGFLAVKDRAILVFLQLCGTCAGEQPSKFSLRESIPSVLQQIEAATSKADLNRLLFEKLNDICFFVKETKKYNLHISVKKAIDYIEKNFMKDLSLELVAETIGVSPYHLSHLFRQELDTSYISFLTETRIKAAERLIQERCFTIHEISRRVGYRSASYLSKVFLKKRGALLKDVAGLCTCVWEP